MALKSYTLAQNILDPKSGCKPHISNTTAGILHFQTLNGDGKLPASHSLNSSAMYLFPKDLESVSCVYMCFFGGALINKSLFNILIIIIMVFREPPAREQSMLIII